MIAATTKKFVAAATGMNQPYFGVIADIPPGGACLTVLAIDARLFLRTHPVTVEVYAPPSAGQVPRTRTRSDECRSNLVRLCTTPPFCAEV